MTPHLVLVHGAWHGSWCWQPVQRQLLRQGVTSEAVDLPGPGRAPGDCGLRGQAAWLRRLVATIDREVVLVGHSYGGQVVSEASAGLSNVVGLVYVAAFLARAGESCRDIDQSGPTPSRPPAREITEDGRVLLALDASMAVEAFYDDCLADVAARACERLTPEVPATVRAPLVHEGWRDHPTRYVVCARDKVLHPSIQERLAKRADTSSRLASGHTPMLSMPTAMADELADTSWLADASASARSPQPTRPPSPAQGAHVAPPRQPTSRKATSQ